MATFSEIAAQLDSLDQQIADTLQLYIRTIGVGGGYTLVARIIYDNGAASVAIRLEGPEKNINKIPLLILARFLAVARKIKDWESGAIDDLPGEEEL